MKDNKKELSSAKNMYVQKANPLLSLSETSMSLAEFKILDAYLSRINSHKPETRYVTFQKGELERLLGVKKINQNSLENRLSKLFQVVTIRDGNKNDGFSKIALFEKAEAKKDENGMWQVNLACTPSAMEYVFNVDTMGYLPYMLKNIIEITSRYSYILYLYLEKNRFRKSWVEPLDELKTLLRCTECSYDEYKLFNNRILKKCYKELNEKTSLMYSYEPVRKGRFVAGIKFTVHNATDEIYVNEQGKLEASVDEEIDYGGELANLLGDSACNNEFTTEEIRVLQDLVLQVCKGKSNIEMTDYLSRQVHKMNLYDKQKKIKNRFTYLCKMIEKENI